MEKKSKMNQKKMINYYKKQNEWKNKLNERRSEKDIIKNEKEEKKYKAYFHPKLSRGTEEIIIAMNEAKENYLYQTTETSNNNYFICFNFVFCIHVFFIYRCRTINSL